MLRIVLRGQPKSLDESIRQIETRPATEADLDAVTSALQRLDPIWEVLYPEELRRVLELLVDEIDVGKTAVTVQFSADDAAVKTRSLSRTPGGTQGTWIGWRFSSFHCCRPTMYASTSSGTNRTTGTSRCSPWIRRAYSSSDSPSFRGRTISSSPLATRLATSRANGGQIGASEGRYSTHILLIDFGPELGLKKSLAKLTPNYEGEELLGRQVLCVVNFPPRQIGKHRSEVLTLGVPDEVGNVVLLRPERDVPLGGRLY